MNISKQSLVVLIAGFLLAGYSFMTIWNYQKKTWENQFSQQVELTMLQLVGKLETNAEALFGISTLFESSTHVTREEFKTATSPVLKRNDFIHALDWAPKVKQSDRDSFVAKVKAEGYPNYMIKEPFEDSRWVQVSEREEYFPILYREPAKDGEWLLGFDQLRSTDARETVKQSRLSRKPLATKVFLLNQNKAKIPVTLLFFPSYIKTQKSADLVKKNGNLRGFLFGVYNMEKMMNAIILPYLPRGLTMTIYQDQETQGNLIYGERHTNRPLMNKSDVDFFGQSWIIVWQGSFEFLNGFNKSNAFLGAGIVFFGSIFLAIIFHMNFTRRLQIEMEVVNRTEELNQARDEAEKASRAKSQFISAMSHELKTPMNAILGFSQVLKNDKDVNEKQKKMIVSIYKTGNHLMGLISDILDFTKPEQVSPELKLIDFDLANLLKDLSIGFKNSCQQKNIDWQKEGFDDNRHILVNGDRGRLRKILINLLTNAVKFTDAGSVSLKIFEASKDQFRFEVLDTGVGVPLDQQESIFESFHQEEKGFKKGGLGLGLSIAKSNVALMGGKLLMESQLEKGTRFFFTLNLPSAKYEIEPLDHDIEVFAEDEETETRFHKSLFMN